MRIRPLRSLRGSPLSPEAWREAAVQGLPGERLAARPEVHAIELRAAGAAGPGSAEADYRAAVESLFRYQVFPEWRLEAAVGAPDGRVRKGVVVAQRIRVAGFGIDSAVRVTEVFAREERGVLSEGYTYVALAGHPERGHETFAAHWDRASGRVWVTIEPNSLPGHWLTWLLYPWTLRIQRDSIQAALEQVRARVREPELARLGAGRAHPVVLFDGVCNFCNASVNLMLERDRAGRLRFASIQSEAGAELMRAHGLDPQALDTMVLIEDGRAFTRSTAALRVGRHLSGWPRALAWLGLRAPLFAREAAYRLVARNRYRWFGKTERCRLPSPEERARFIG